MGGGGGGRSSKFYQSSRGGGLRVTVWMGSVLSTVPYILYIHAVMRGASFGDLIDGVQTPAAKQGLSRIPNLEVFV